MSQTSICRVLAALSAALFVCSVAQAEAPADVVLARNADATLTRADWDAELTRIPADQRVAFQTNPQRIQTSLNNLLVNRTLAERARAAGVDKDPIVQRRLALETDRALAALMVERIEADAGAEFDRGAEKNLARARELYLINQSRYAVAEEVDVWHILFDTSKRGKEAALTAANDARARLLAGADFGTLAMELSDDATATRNKGRLGSGPRGRFEPAFDAAAFALVQPGDISEPVLTRYGYHVIRLAGRRPARQQTFDQVRGQILAEMRQKYVNDTRDAVTSAIRTDTRLEVNQAAVDALVVNVNIPPPVSTPNTAAPAAAPPAK